MFTGFTPETIDFLWGIRMNNNREWFQEHKKQYVDTLYEPMKALAKELEPEFLIPTIEKLLLTDGQSIQTAARRAYRKKLISREKFLAIRSERSSMGDLFEE